MNFAAIEKELALRSGMIMHLSCATRPLDLSALSAAEAQTAAGFANAARRDSWLLGRAALKSLLRRFDMNLDTTRLAFPHRRLSLTHSGETAVAAGSAANGIEGVGVDFERTREMRMNAARFFLKEEEYSWAGKQRDASTLLLRLWTVKEAVFKADMLNAGRALRNYQVRLPFEDHGAACGDDGRIFAYASFLFPEGALAIAWKEKEVSNERE